MRPGRRTFWCSGGDLLAVDGRRIDEADAYALRGLYLDEMRAAADAAATRAHADALRLANELNEALEVAQRWRRAMIIPPARRQPHVNRTASGNGYGRTRDNG